MRTLQNKLYRLFILLVICLLSAAMPAFAQPNAQSVFNSTVDQINCETIRFIHREAGRAEIANNLNCFSFESILKSIPEDEARTTAALAKDIEAFKTKYKSGDELAVQLDNVISFANKKIEAKPRKGNVADFKQKLQGYRKDAIDNISGPSTTAAPQNQPAPGGGSIDEDLGEEGGIILTDDEPQEAPGNTGWLTYLSLLIGLLSLGLSAYLFSKIGQLSRARSAMPVAAPEPEGNKPRGPLVNESMANYQLLETKMYQEIARISREFDDKLAAVTASTGYTQPENYTASPTTSTVKETTPPFIPTPVDQADAPILTTEERVQTSEPKPETIADSNITEVFNNTEDDENDVPKPDVDFAAADEEETIEDDYAGEKYAEEEQPVENISAQNTVRSDNASNMPPVAAANIADDEEEDGIALPDYKYLGLPLQDGSFAPQSFTDAPSAESLYEVEMYEDVPNKAFFSPLLYPEVIEKALSDPETYLAPCCMFLNEAAGKQVITVIEEGRLRRQGERWYIYEKARIRFD